MEESETLNRLNDLEMQLLSMQKMLTDLHRMFISATGFKRNELTKQQEAQIKEFKKGIGKSKLVGYSKYDILEMIALRHQAHSKMIIQFPRKPRKPL